MTVVVLPLMRQGSGTPLFSDSASDQHGDSPLHISIQCTFSFEFFEPKATLKFERPGQLLRLTLAQALMPKQLPAYQPRSTPRAHH